MKRQQTKGIAVQMTEAAREHKGKQDDLLRKNAQLREQLMNMRRSMVEAKRIYFEENA